MLSAAMRDPSASAAERTSARTHWATASAIGQASVAPGVIFTLWPSGIMISSRRTRSTAPHAPGPSRSGSREKRAISARRMEHSLGAAGAVELACRTAGLGGGSGTGSANAEQTRAVNAARANNPTIDFMPSRMSRECGISGVRNYPRPR